MRIINAALGAAIAFATGSVHANDLPRYDPVAYCDQVSEAAGGSMRIKNRCIDQEQESYNKLQTEWEIVATETQRHCHDVSRMTGGSYRMLERCVISETKEAANPSQFKF